MYPVTNEEKALFLEEQRQVVMITMNTQDEEPLRLDESHVMQGSLSIDRSSVSGSKIEIGSAIASELKVTLDNSDGAFDNITFEGAELVVQVGTARWENENPTVFYLPMGYFTIDKIPRKLTTIQLTGLDRMVRFDKPYDSTLSYPATLEQVLVDACNNCNVMLSTTMSSLPNFDYRVSARPEGKDLTYRAVVQWVAELTGTCAFIDWAGELRLEWYRDTGVQITESERYSSDLYENPITLTGVRAEVNDTVHLFGTDDYAINIESNGLLQDNAAPVLEQIYEKVNGFTYTPYTCSAKPMPFLFPLDKVMFVKDGREVPVIVTNQTFALNKQTSLQGKGETATANSYASANPLSKQQKAIVETVKKEVGEALNDRVQSVFNFNDTICNAMGVYSTMVPQPDGSFKPYLHDNKTLETSNTIYTINDGGFAFTNSGWNGGNPVWETGIKKDGNAIFKMVSAYGVELSDPNSNYSAKITPKEFALYYRTLCILTVSGDITELTKMKANTYAEVGRIRWLPHENGGDFICVD